MTWRLEKFLILGETQCPEGRHCARYMAFKKASGDEMSHSPNVDGEVSSEIRGIWYVSFFFSIQ
jgi:hypothetical protein